MVKLICEEVQDGPGPRQKTGTFKSSDGRIEQLTGSASSFVDGKSIEVAVVDKDEKVGRSLIELPQETSSGKWRVWVNKDNICS